MKHLFSSDNFYYTCFYQNHYPVNVSLSPGFYHVFLLLCKLYRSVPELKSEARLRMEHPAWMVLAKGRERGSGRLHEWICKWIRDEWIRSEANAGGRQLCSPSEERPIFYVPSTHIHSLFLLTYSIHFLSVYRFLSFLILILIIFYSNHSPLFFLISQGSWIPLTPYLIGINKQDMSWIQQN